MDVLTFEICIQGRCFKISKASRRKKAGRDLDCIMDKKVERGGRFWGMGHCDPQIPSDFFLFILVKNFFHLYKEKVPVRSTRGRFVQSAVKIGII
ncbi:hypothetical protein ES703_69880 [subsurface metagenome]